MQWLSRCLPEQVQWQSFFLPPSFPFYILLHTVLLHRRILILSLFFQLNGGKELPSPLRWDSFLFVFSAHNRLWSQEVYSFEKYPHFTNYNNCKKKLCFWHNIPVMSVNVSNLKTKNRKDRKSRATMWACFRSLGRYYCVLMLSITKKERHRPVAGTGQVQSRILVRSPTHVMTRDCLLVFNIRSTW